MRNVWQQKIFAGPKQSSSPIVWIFCQSRWFLWLLEVCAACCRQAAFTTISEARVFLPRSSPGLHIMTWHQTQLPDIETKIETEDNVEQDTTRWAAAVRGKGAINFYQQYKTQLWQEISAAEMYCEWFIQAKAFWLFLMIQAEKNKTV